MSKKVHSTNTLSDMYALSAQDIEEFIVAEGKICFDVDSQNFLIFVPSLDSFVTLKDFSFHAPKYKADVLDFEIVQEEALLKVNSNKKFPSAFLMLNDLVPTLEQYMDITDSTCFLASDRLHVPLFFGHENVIRRLADDFDGTRTVYSVKDFIKWRQKNV
jgi:hypothetical protein